MRLKDGQLKNYNMQFLPFHDETEFRINVFISDFHVKNFLNFFFFDICE